MTTRRLALRRETLAALSTDDLANVAGAVAVPDHTLDLQCVLTRPSVLQCPRSFLPCETSPCTS